MSTATAPSFSWTDVVRSHLPDGARAYRVDVQSAELAVLTAGFVEAWSIWVDTTFVGVVARGDGSWLWLHAEVQIVAHRVDLLPTVQRDVATFLENRDRSRLEAGK